MGIFLLACALGFAGQGRAGSAAVTNVRVSPTSFSPNADGIKDFARLSWTLSDAAARIEIEVERSDQASGVTTYRRIDLGARPAGRDSFDFDGLDSLGVVLPDTIYSLRVSQFEAVVDTLLASAVASVRIDTRPPSLPQFDVLTDTVITKPAYEVSGFASGADSIILFREGIPFDTSAVANSPPVFGFSVTLADGDNVFAVQSYDRAGNHSPLTPALVLRYVNTAEVSLARVVPTRFSPNGDGRLDSTRVSFVLDAATTRLAVQVHRAIGLTVVDSLPLVRLHDGPAPPDSFVFVWDGRDSLGTAVADQGYYFTIQAESIAINGAPVPGAIRTLRVELDTTPPLAPVLNPPLPATTSRATIAVAGSATQADTVYIYRNGTLISRAGNPFSVQVPLALGNNDFTLQAYDAAGNQSALVGPFTVIYAEQLGFHANERFRRNDVFDLNLNAPARSVTIDLYTLDGRKVRTLSSTASTLRYEIAWNLLDDVGESVGSGPYVAHLQVVFPDGTMQERRAAIVVVP